MEGERQEKIIYNEEIFEVDNERDLGKTLFTFNLSLMPTNLLIEIVRSSPKAFAEYSSFIIGQEINDEISLKTEVVFFTLGTIIWDNPDVFEKFTYFHEKYKKEEKLLNKLEKEVRMAFNKYLDAVRKNKYDLKNAWQAVVNYYKIVNETYYEGIIEKYLAVAGNLSIFETNQVKQNLEKGRLAVRLFEMELLLLAKNNPRAMSIIILLETARIYLVNSLMRKFKEDQLHQEIFDLVAISYYVSQLIESGINKIIEYSHNTKSVTNYLIKLKENKEYFFEKEFAVIPLLFDDLYSHLLSNFTREELEKLFNHQLFRGVVDLILHKAFIDILVKTQPDDYISKVVLSGKYQDHFPDMFYGSDEEKWFNNFIKLAQTILTSDQHEIQEEILEKNRELEKTIIAIQAKLTEMENDIIKYQEQMANSEKIRQELFQLRKENKNLNSEIASLQQRLKKKDKVIKKLETKLEEFTKKEQKADIKTQTKAENVEIENLDDLLMI